MSDSVKLFLIIAAIAAIVVFCVGLAALLDRAGCEARWEDSGRRHEWGFMSGCRVADKEGRLIPAANVRDMQ